MVGMLGGDGGRREARREGEIERLNGWQGKLQARDGRGAEAIESSFITEAWRRWSTGRRRGCEVEAFGGQRRRRRRRQRARGREIELKPSSR